MMIERLSKRIIIGAFFMCLMVPGSYTDKANGARKRITIGILPCTDAVMTFKMFHPLITYIEHETGFDIKMAIPRNFTEFERDIKNGDMDFALQDPHTYVRLAGLYDKSAIIRALNPDGTATQSAVVIARKDSGMNKLEDIRGKTVMFGPRLSAHKWLAAKLLFEQNGINIDKDLKAYSNGGCCEDIAFSVYIKRVDAGLVCDHFFMGHLRRQPELGIDIKQILDICRTKLIPTRVLAARQEISKAVVAKVNQALLRLDKEKRAHTKILSRAELGGFQKSKDEDYDGIRMLIGEKTAE